MNTLMKISGLVIASALIISCGTKNENSATAANEEATSGTVTPEYMIERGLQLVEGSDCKTCHHPTAKIVGPSHTEVAKKYEFTKANVTLLSDKIIKGGSGVWGDVPMNPHTDITPAEAERMAMYVLSLDGEKFKEK